MHLLRCVYVLKSFQKQRYMWRHYRNVTIIFKTSLFLVRVFFNVLFTIVLLIITFKPL